MLKKLNFYPWNPHFTKLYQYRLETLGLVLGGWALQQLQKTLSAICV